MRQSADLLQKHPEETEARRLAKELTTLLITPLRLLNPFGKEQEYTVADLIRTGAFVLSLGNEAFRDNVIQGLNREFFAKVFETTSGDSGALEEFLFQTIKQKPLSAVEIREAAEEVAGLNSRPNAARKLLKEAWEFLVPKGKAGRPAQFDPNRDGEAFLKLSENLHPFCCQFVKLREGYPSKSLGDICDFLASEYPAQSSLARKHCLAIEEIFNDPYFQELQKLESRTRRLADALAGKELRNLRHTYSIQIGGELRRAADRTPEE